jgi:hypothetical protein
MSGREARQRRNKMTNTEAMKQQARATRLEKRRVATLVENLMDAMSGGVCTGPVRFEVKRTLKSREMFANMTAMAEKRAIIKAKLDAERAALAAERAAAPPVAPEPEPEPYELVAHSRYNRQTGEVEYD